MNTYIERIENIRFSLWDGLHISAEQTLLLFLFVASASSWLMERSKKALQFGLGCLLIFSGLRSRSFLQTKRQQKIIVYNVPQKSAIDFINGRTCFFAGDSDLLLNDFARNFHLKPARVLLRVKNSTAVDGLSVQGNFIDYLGKRILIIDRPVTFKDQNPRPVIDLLVISKNPRVYMKTLAAKLELRQVVFDGSSPSWKTNFWKKDCDSLHIPWHDVTMKGAFVMNLR